MIKFRKNFLYFIFLFLFFNYHFFIYATKDENIEQKNENMKQNNSKEDNHFNSEKKIIYNEIILEEPKKDDIAENKNINPNILFSEDDKKHVEIKDENVELAKDYSVKKISDFFELIIKECNNKPSTSNDFSHVIQMSDLISKIDLEANAYANAVNIEDKTTTNNILKENNNNVFFSKKCKYFKYLFLSLTNLFLGSFVCYFLNNFFHFN